MSSRRRRPSAIADPGSGPGQGLERALGPDRALALAHVPVRDRRALSAMLLTDAAMGDVLRSTTEPMLGQIRLAWWRERLEEVDQGVAAAEPRLSQVLEQLPPRGIRGRDLAGLENGWLRLLDPFPWDAGTAEAVWFRGRLLFALGAKLLDKTGDDIEEAGGVWALVDAARHCSDQHSRTMLLDQARTFARRLAKVRFPSRLRPLSSLAAVAVRDVARGEPFEAEGTRGRAFAMLRHRWTGRLPRLG